MNSMVKDQGPPRKMATDTETKITAGTQKTTTAADTHRRLTSDIDVWL